MSCLISRNPVAPILHPLLTSLHTHSLCCTSHLTPRNAPLQCEVQVPVGFETWSYSINMTIRVDPWDSSQLLPSLVWGQVSLERGRSPVILGNSGWFPL